MNITKSNTPLVIAILLALLAGILAISPIASYDVWWILAAGERVLETGAIPTTGSGSWTRGAESYVYHGWGFAVVAAGCRRMAGEWGLIGLRALLAATCFFFLALAIAARGARGQLILLFPGLAVLFGFTNLFWPVRPQSASQMLLAVLLLVLAREYSIGGRGMLLAVPILFLWANLHGGALLGVIVLVIAISGGGIDHWRKGADLKSWPWKWRSAALFLGILACFCTPYGVRGVLSAIRHIGGELAATAPMEWGTPRIADYPIFVFLLCIAAVGVLAAFLRERFCWTDMMFFMLFAFMGLRSLRYLVIGAIGLAYVATLSWTNVLQDFLRSKLTSSLGYVASAVVLGCLLANGIGRDPFLFMGGWRPGRPLPVPAVQFLSDHKITRRLINPYEWGGYLIWAFRPQDVAFIDGRADLYTSSFIGEYLTLDGGARGWREVVDHYSAQAILWRANLAGLPLRQALAADPAFVLIYSDPVAVIYVRKDGDYQHLIHSLPTPPSFSPQRVDESAEELISLHTAR